MSHAIPPPAAGLTAAIPQSQQGFVAPSRLAPGGGPINQSWRALVSRSAPLRVLGAFIDLAVVVGLGYLAWWLTRDISTVAGIATVALVVVPLLAIMFWLMATRGRALGGYLLGLRTLDKRTGFPPRGPLGVLGLAGVDVARTRGAVDPLSPTPLTVAGEAIAMEPVVLRIAPTPRVVHRVAYVDFNGVETPIGERLAIGRFASTRSDEDRRGLLELNDMTRTVSRDHCVLESDETGRVWITDNDSSNGTYVVHGEELQQLPPQERTALDDTDHIALGKQHLRIVYHVRSES